jgi:predicted nucleotidyltransferase
VTTQDPFATLAEYFDTHQLPGLVSAYLFGSHASGLTHRDSDVDVGVLLDWSVYTTAADRFDVRLRLAGDLPAVIGAPADIVILNDAPPGLGRAVVTAGRRIYLGNAALDHAYVRDVQLRAADVEPWLQRVRRTKLRAIAR